MKLWFEEDIIQEIERIMEDSGWSYGDLDANEIKYKRGESEQCRIRPVYTSFWSQESLDVNRFNNETELDQISKRANYE